MCLKEVELCAQNLATRSNSQHYEVRGERGTCMIIKKKESLQFDNEQSIHMSSENDEEIGYGVDVDVLIILCKLYCSIS